MVEIDTKEQSKNELQDGIEEIFKDEELNKLLKEKLSSCNDVNLSFSLDENKEVIATVINGANNVNSDAEITNAIANKALGEIVKEKLENNEDISISFSTGDNKGIVATVTNSKRDTNVYNNKENVEIPENEEKTSNPIKKIFDATFDEVAKYFIKKKTGVTYTTYNDFKKGITALKKSDTKNMIKKFADVGIRISYYQRRYR